MNAPITEDQMVRAAIDNSTYAYAEEYLCVDGEPFSFKNHNYLIDIYLDDHPYVVIEKSAQMGASVYGMSRAFRVCDKMGKNTIYFFPTDTDVLDFSKTRVGPMVRDSAHLRNIIGKSDSLGLRQVGRGWLYFRGMKSNIAMKSIPADFLIFDELDEVTPAAESLADKRLHHSSLKWRLKLSTPTFEGYGIDREFLESDQRYWNLICKQCGTKNVLEESFPDCVAQREDRFYLQCFKCSAELDTQYGRWIAKKPEVTRKHGYHICGLYSHFLDLGVLMDEYNSGRNRGEFFRSTLGMPYTSANQRITLAMVEACAGSYDLGQFDNTCLHSFMGVDQKGDQLHIVIGKYDRLLGKDHLSFVGTVKKFEELDQFMRRWDIDCCVIDGTPNQHSARDFAARFPNRVYLCYYSEHQKGDYNFQEPNKEKQQDDWKVDVNRTEAIDAMFEQIMFRKIEYPRDVEYAFKVQLTQLARVNEEDDDGNILRAVWKRLGEDHYAHANSYRLIAQSRFSNERPGALLLQSKRTAARLAYSRHYEMNSRF